MLVDIPSHSVIIPIEIRSPIPLLGGRYGKEILKPHFLKERWGFLMTSSWMGPPAYGNEAAIATAIQKRLEG